VKLPNFRIQTRFLSLLSAAVALPLFFSIGCSDPVDDPMGGSGGVTGGGGTASGGAGSGGASSGGAGSGGAASGGASSGGAGSGGAASGGAGTGGDGAGTGGDSGSGEFTLTSAEITDGEPIPAAHTCDGGGGQGGWGISPSLKWENPPEGTMSYAFFMIDWTLTMGASSDVNGYHSAAWNIPTTITELDLSWTAAADLPGATAINGGYFGPCPPSGTDTYHLIIMALPMASYTLNGAGTQGVKAAYDMLKDVALDTAEVTGTYMQQ
jgi:phosphatidylethanolamine-binding protein (PEBP) family uncharacterized protein